jgi:ABC-2 type transport system permease protein
MDSRIGGVVADRAPVRNEEVGGAGRMKVYLQLVSARIRADAQYRISFVFRLTSSSLLVLGDYFVVWALLARVGTIGGWNRSQATFLFGFGSLGFRTADAFIGGPVERCAEYIRSGEFDRFLLRPIRPMVGLMGDAFAFRRVGQMLVTIPIAAGGAVAVGLPANARTALVLGLVLINAIGISSSLFVVLCSLAFWSPNTNEIANSFTYGGATVNQYPVHIMGSFVRGLAFTVMPVAFAVYVPSFLLVGAANPLGVTPLMSWLSLAAWIPLALVGSLVWRQALKRYGSTGS